jgi:hypothetical protein
MWVRALRLLPMVCTGKVRVIAWSLPCNLRMPSTCAFACGASPLPPCPNEAFPFEHDFGSILAFIENNFLPAGQIGKINPGYPFADAFAPDYAPPPNRHVPLADFFPLTTPRPFQAIMLPPGAPSATDFINYNGPILDPDNDAIDND